jgi:triosephosphate isomerase
MFKTTDEAAGYVDRFIALLAEIPEAVEIVLCPPFTAIAAVARILAAPRAGRIKTGAQNMHWESSGAFTGEISAPMLLDAGVQYVILGHSERRMYFGETDEMVRRKTAAALEQGLTPIVAVGEPLETRRAGRAREYVLAQVHAALGELRAEDLRRVVVAYEPIWAIGTGENCDPAAANEIMQAIHDALDGLQESPVLYGGSVKPGNIAEYTAQPAIDGGLVGGASLDPDGFAALARAAAP